MRIKGFLAIAALFFASACGAPDGAESVELGEVQQGITKEANFGVRSDNGWECNSAHTGTCYYSEPGAWRVFLNTASMGGSMGAIASNALDDVIFKLNQGQSGSTKFAFTTFRAFEFVRWPTLIGSHITITAGSVGCSSGPCLQGIEAYVSATCNSFDGALPETPALNGTHRFCNSWASALDVIDISANWALADRDNVARHAIASVLLRAEGVGLGGAVVGWNGTDIPTNLANDLFLQAFPVSNAARCRQHFASEGGTSICFETSCSFGFDSCD